MSSLSIAAVASVRGLIRVLVQALNQILWMQPLFGNRIQSLSAIGSQLSARLGSRCAPAQESQGGKDQLRKIPVVNFAQLDGQSTHSVLRLRQNSLSFARAVRRSRLQNKPLSQRASCKIQRFCTGDCDFHRDEQIATRCRAACYDDGRKNRRCKTLWIPRFTAFCPRAREASGAKSVSSPRWKSLALVSPPALPGGSGRLAIAARDHCSITPGGAGGCRLMLLQTRGFA
jgi:hypothetical protein